MNEASVRLLGTAVIWAGMWVGMAVALGDSPEFAMVIPLLLGGTAGSLLVVAAPATSRGSRPRPAEDRPPGFVELR